MASFRAHLLNFVLRRTVKAQLLRSQSAATIRKLFNASQPATPRDCRASNQTLGGVPGEWMQSAATQPIGTMLYLHGGAYVGCSPITHRPITSGFARLGWKVFAPDYRLAPEHKFPAQLHDAVAVYRALLESGVDPKQLVVAGDSAGGNLTLALCLSLRDAALPLPAAVALFSPVTDFAWTGDSIRANNESCAMFAQQTLSAAVEHFLGSHNPRDPLASPYYADLHGLPPMLLHASNHELLRDDSVRVAARANQAGVEAKLGLWDNVPHIWLMWHRWLPEGRESLREAHAFLAKHLA